MQNKELSALLEDRDPLAAQTVLELSGDSGEPASFRIDALLGAGGSSLVYRVTRLSESEGSVQGSLKEFYPCSVGGGSQDMDSLLASMSVARTPDGSLKLPREMCETRAGRLRSVMHALHDLKRSGDLNYFIPYMQLYHGKYGVPYVFTPENLSGVTLETYLRDAHQTPDRSHLLQILNTLYAIASADELLCSKGALLLDIKPANVLMVRRSGARGEETAYLADAVSLFDVESILLRSELDGSPELPVSPGFTAPELGGAVSLPRYFKIGPASDVYALAATLFYALTGQLPEAVDDCGAALAACPFAEVLQQDDLYGMLGRLLSEGLMFEPTERIATPREFGTRVMEVITRVQMHRIAETARAGREEAEKLPEMLAHLLFRWPLHEYASDGDMRVLIAGGGELPVRQALDALFAACHVLGHQLHLAVVCPEARAITRKWCGEIYKADSWLDCRGGELFTPYAWQDFMAQICWDETAVSRETINQLAEKWRANTVLLLTENQAEGKAMALALRPPGEGRRLVAYRGGWGKTLYPEQSRDGQTVICMTPAACDDSFLDAADRIGFNAHFLYEREKDRTGSLQSIRRSYRNNAYNYTASQETALAVKCKLWSAGVPWSGEAAADAALFEERLRCDPGLIPRISWLEHRRWMASKLVRGVRPLPEEQYELLLAGDNNESVTNIRLPAEDGREHLFHAYLVPSRMDGSRPEGWQTPARWAARPLNEPIPAELDPLDRACVGLTRMYVRTAACINLKASEGALADKLDRHLEWLESHSSPQAEEFALLAENMKRAVKRLEDPARARPESITPYENARLCLQQTLAKQQSPWVPSTRSALENLDREARIMIQSLRGIDAKRYDATLVENMRFLLCGGGLTLGILLSDGCLLDNLRPAEVFLPDRVVCAAYAASEKAARRYAGIYADLRGCFAIRGMDAPAELRLFLAPGVSAPEGAEGLVPIPVEESLESCFAAVMADCSALDVTGGQPALVAAGSLLDSCRVPLIEMEGERPRALRGTLPPVIPVRQPMTIDAAFALSGARCCGEEEEGQGGELYRDIFAEYQAIRREMSGPAWHDACEAFRKGYEKFSHWQLAAPAPEDPMDTPCECLLSKEECKTLIPLFRSMEAEGFLKDLEEQPYGDRSRVRMTTTLRLADFLRHRMELIQKNYFVVERYERADFGRCSFHVYGRPNQVRPDLPSADAVRVYERLAAKGWMQWDPTQKMARYVRPELVRMLLKEGSILEADTALQLMQSGLFEECRTNYEYRWFGDRGPANEVDVVAMCGGRLVLVSCKACKELDPAMAYEVRTEAQNLKVNALPVLVASELKAGEKPAFRERCRALGVLLIDADDQKNTAAHIAAAAEKTL